MSPTEKCTCALPSCGKNITKSQGSISCKKCLQWCHASCVGISVEQLEIIGKSKGLLGFANCGCNSVMSDVNTFREEFKIGMRDVQEKFDKILQEVKQDLNGKLNGLKDEIHQCNLMISKIDVNTKKSTSSGGLKEWAILELQGDLEVRTNESMHDQFVGDLYYNKYGQPILIIGHHILQGREQKLDKPFAVLEKSKTNEGENLLDETASNFNASIMNNTVDKTILDNTVALENKSRQKSEYTVQAVITKKLIFKSRPKPIIANVAKSV